MKKLKYFGITLLISVLGLTGVNATEVTKVTSVVELNTCILANGICQLQNNITAEEVIASGEDIKATIDLNGKNLYSWLTVTDNAQLTLEDSGENGAVIKDNTVAVYDGGTFILNSGTIDATAKGNGIWLEGGTAIMNGGTIKAYEFGIAYNKKSTVTINAGTIETIDNVAIGDNGTKGWGGNTVTVNGGNLISNIKSAGSISCGIYNANDTTLTVKSGVKITANNGGAGIVVRGGNVTIAKDVIDNMVTGTTKGTVGDSKIIVAGKIVKDYDSKYPAMDTINVTIDYNTVSDEDTTNATESKQKIALNNEISYIINNNKIESLKNVDLTDLAIKTVSSDVTEDTKEKAIEGAKEALKDKIANYTIAEAVDLKVVVTNKDVEVYNVTETANKIPFGIDVTSIATNNKLNYEFQIIRVHTTAAGDEYEILDSTYDAKNGIVSFESDKFSTYLVSYKTTAKPVDTNSNPNTSDAIAIYAGLLTISSLAIGAFVLRKRYN